MKEVTVQELKQKMDNNEDFQLIDVRETFEYETSNLNGENIPLGGILIEADKIATDKPVIVQCRSGNHERQNVHQAHCDQMAAGCYVLVAQYRRCRLSDAPDSPCMGGGTRIHSRRGSCRRVFLFQQFQFQAKERLPERP